MLSHFYDELQNQNLSCLNYFHVEWNRISIGELRSEKHLYKKISEICYKKCDTAAEGRRIQRGREYGFFNEQFNERATIVSEMLDNDLTLIPSHNLDCERNLPISGIHIENTSKCLNRHFKAQSTGNNVMLHKFSQVKRIKRDIKEVLVNVNRSGIINKKSLRRTKLKNCLK